MCAMIETYDSPVTFFFLCYFLFHTVFPYLSIMRTLIFYLNFVFYFEDIWIPPQN